MSTEIVQLPWCRIIKTDQYGQVLLVRSVYDDGSDVVEIQIDFAGKQAGMIFEFDNEVSAAEYMQGVDEFELEHTLEEIVSNYHAEVMEQLDEI